MKNLQAKLKSLIEGMSIPLYEDLKGGELFRVLQPVSFEYLVRTFAADFDPDCPFPIEDCGACSGEEYAWEKLLPGDMLMFVSQRIDAEGEILPKWVITSGAEKDQVRIRELYIASHKLEKIEIKTAERKILPKEGSL